MQSIHSTKEHFELISLASGSSGPSSGGAGPGPQTQALALTTPQPWFPLL